MRQPFEHLAAMAVSLVLSMALLAGSEAGAADRAAAAKQPPRPSQTAHAPSPGIAQQDIEIEVVKKLDGLHTSLCDKLTRLAVDVLSGNAAHLLAENQTDLLAKNKMHLLSGNSPELLSGNCPKLLSENQTPLLSGNRCSVLSEIKVLSDVKVEIHIHLNDSGNVSHSGNNNRAKQ
jgi:hypothetical protein